MFELSRSLIQILDVSLYELLTWKRWAEVAAALHSSLMVASSRPSPLYFLRPERSRVTYHQPVRGLTWPGWGSSACRRILPVNHSDGTRQRPKLQVKHRRSIWSFRWVSSLFPLHHYYRTTFLTAVREQASAPSVFAAYLLNRASVYYYLQDKKEKKRLIE